MFECAKSDANLLDRKPFAFDTLSVDPHRAFDYWSEAVTAHFSPTQNTTLPCPSGFHGRMQVTPIGVINVSHMQTSAMRNVRDLWSLRNIPNDDFFVMAVNSGIGGKLSQLGRQVYLGPGDMMIYDSAREFSFEFIGNTDLYLAQIPRRLLKARLKNPESIIARAISHTDPLSVMLLTMLKSFTQLHDSPTNQSFLGLSKSFIDMLTSSLECSLVSSELSPAHSNLLERAKSIVASNLEDPAFDVSQLAHSLGASPRTLCRIFAAEGTTAIRYLWQNRLEMAKTLIVEGQIKQVSQIALRCGFSDFSHFSRSFKKEFNTTPKQLLTSRIS